MTLLLHESSQKLWQDVVKSAEDQCKIRLQEDLECYLISLLSRYTDKPEIAKQVFATAFLEAMKKGDHERNQRLQHIGDTCLIFAGLFPKATERRLVKLSYFVDLGRSAYSAINSNVNKIYLNLAFQFVPLMDVLQSIRTADLTPFEAYEQWQTLGSARALNLLTEYSNVISINIGKKYTLS